ncbi:MAG: cytochrome c4 [Proteobacteria bacterium]|nr:cytochrome c4 [Pseudomonadota bacterium]
MRRPFLLTCITTLGVALLGCGAYAATPATSKADAEAARLATTVCSNCHGPGGDSVSPLFPKLAAQQQSYLAAQIRAFKNRSARGEPEAGQYMHGMAALVDDATIDALARYYARQKPPAGRGGDPALINKGRALYLQGSSDHRVVPCASCHGQDGVGNGPIPRLAGQHSAYVAHQLDVIQKQQRKAPVMYGIVHDLKPDEIRQVAAYVQSL